MSINRPALRRALLDAEPWLAATDNGPQAVTAGSCDRCGVQPRLLPTCGPSAYEALCRDCADIEGDEAWCEGHVDDGHNARAWAASLPPRWPDIVVLWWVATGEVALDALPAPVERGDLPAAVRAALPGR